MLAPRRRPQWIVAAFALALMLLAACSSTHPAHPGPAASAAPLPVASSFPPGTAPTQTFAVGLGSTTVACSGQHAMAVSLYYPAASRGTGVPYMAGHWPVVLFSHGLQLVPASYDALLRIWAAAGFVVVAPTYPRTASNSASYDSDDVVNQPADAQCVLTSVLADPKLRDHLDAAHIAAAGHSAGAATTLALFTAPRDTRLSAGVILAGYTLDSAADTGPATPLLFVHGDVDPMVSYAKGQAAYKADPWKKAFLTLPGGDHLDPYLNGLNPNFGTASTTTTDFLRWTLYGDPAAKRRLKTDADATGHLVQTW